LSEDWAGLSEDWAHLWSGLSEDWVYLRPELSEDWFEDCVYLRTVFSKLGEREFQSESEYIHTIIILKRPTYQWNGALRC
jgi:hypothetical protein